MEKTLINIKKGLDLYCISFVALGVIKRSKK